MGNGMNRSDKFSLTGGRFGDLDPSGVVASAHILRTLDKIRSADIFSHGPSSEPTEEGVDKKSRREIRARLSWRHALCGGVRLRVRVRVGAMNRAMFYLFKADPSFVRGPF